MELERLTLFDVFLNDEQLTRRLEYTKKYAGPDLLNCSNLVLVLLGIVDPRYYLGVCTRRLETTSSEEFISYSKSAMSQCGIQNTYIEERLLPVSDAIPIFSSIRPNHAIPLGVYWKADGSGHSVLLRRNSGGVLEYIDPQVFGGFGGNVYPFKITGDFAIQTYLNQDVSYISVMFSYIGIDEANSLSEKCMTTQAPMDIQGGRKRRKRPSRKNGKKTKKGRKHHAVRTRRRRN